MSTSISDSGEAYRIAAEPLWQRRAAQGAAAIGLAVAAIPIALTACLIGATLGRPLLFEEVRAGLGKRPFTIRKFRTMHDWRDESGALLPDHMRETRLTRFIRRSRLDELPQLLLILRGDMAFVGPRPLWPHTIDGFGELGRHRCSVRPGLTGWAQVNGGTLLTNRQKLAMDIWYVDHRNLALKVKILLRTFYTIVVGERINRSRIETALAHVEAMGGEWGVGVELE